MGLSGSFFVIEIIGVSYPSKCIFSMFSRSKACGLLKSLESLPFGNGKSWDLKNPPSPVAAIH